MTYPTINPTSIWKCKVKLKKVYFALLILLVSQKALAVTVDCVIEAAREAQIPANVLLAIASAEGGKEGQIVTNKNGTSDIGVFQLNTVHWERGGQFYNKVSMQQAAYNGCYSARVAAQVVKKNLSKYQKNEYWTVISYYNSKTPEKNAAYRRKIIHYAKIWGDWLLNHYRNNTH